MTGRVPHEGVAIAALAVAIAAAAQAGVLGPVAFALALVVLALGLARSRHVRAVRVLDQPRWFAVSGAMYLPWFIADLFFFGRANPVPALGRLVVFLMAAELLSGDAARAHRPVLFGLLLLVAAASQTTDAWFAIPVIVFAWLSVTALFRHTLRAQQRHGSSTPLPLARAAALRLTFAGLVMGGVLFLVLPRVGAGWATVTVATEGETALETGLAASVRLGAVGRVKVRRTVAFRARFDREVPDPGAIYWRARSYDEWTGQGWTRRNRDGEVAVPLSPDEQVPVPPGLGQAEPDLVAEVFASRGDLPVLPVPGVGQWVRVSRESTILASPDGTLIPAGRLAGGIWEIAGTLPSASGKAAAAERESPAAGVPSGLVAAERTDPEILRWARRVVPAGASPAESAEALVADLATRRYSLDTRSIDPDRPLGSFLAGVPAHCEYFASALALGLRALGIPARVVGGFLGAERSPWGDVWIIRDARAHLWTEAYFAGQGWVSLDATPAEGRASPPAGLFWAGALWDRVSLAWDTWVIGLDLGDQLDALLGAQEHLARLGGFLRRTSGLMIAAVAVALAACACLWVRRRQRLLPAGDGTRLPPLYASLLAIAARRGIVPRASETARQFALRAGGTLGDEEAFAMVSELYERERFAGIGPSPRERGRAQQALERLRRVARRAGRS